MNRRDLFFRAMHRESGEYVPFEFILCPELLQEFEAKTGTKDYPKYFDFPTRLLFVDYIGRLGKFDSYFETLENISVNDWGVGFKQGSVAHFTHMQHPLGNAASLKDFKTYPFPDPVEDYDWEGFARKVENVKADGLIAVGYLEVTIFELAWYLRGMDEFMIDMAAREEFAECLLENITSRRCIIAEKMARAGCDVIRLGDDVSTQLDMIMHPDMWRKYLKPRLARVISAAKTLKPDVMIFYHGDGNLQKIIPDLIEVGVEILNPVQPECMEPENVKMQYHDKLSFWGTVGTQTTMPFGSTEEVREVCLRMVAKLGKGGGLLLSPTHVLEPDVPWENVMAFVAAVKEYNEGN